MKEFEYDLGFCELLSHLVLTLDQQIQQLLGIDHSFSEVCHKANQCRVPLVDNLCECSGT